MRIVFILGLTLLTFAGCGKSGPTKTELIQEYNYEKGKLDELIKERDVEVRIALSKLKKWSVDDLVRAGDIAKREGLVGEKEKARTFELSDQFKVEALQSQQRLRDTRDKYEKLIDSQKPIVEAIQKKIDSLPKD